MQASQNIVQMARSACARFGTAPAYRCLGATLSFAELDRLSDLVALWLIRDAGLAPGTRVAIQLPNLPQYPVFALGVFKARGVVVNLNPLYTARELLRPLQDTGASVLVVLANVAHVAADVVPQTAVRRVVVCEVGDLLGPLRGRWISWALRYLKRRVPAYAFAAQTGWRELLALGAQGRVAELPSPAFSPDELAVLQFTGGTSGVTKAAMLSHRNLLSNVLQMEAALAPDCPPAGALMVSPLPLYHIYAFTLSILLLLHCGHQALLIPNPRDTAAFIRSLRQVRMHGFLGINTLYRNLLDHPDLARVDFSALRVSSSGGMALSPQVAKEWLARTGVRVVEGYGLTECSPLVSCNTYQDYRTGTVGRPAPGTEVLLLALNGEPAAPGEPGEICVRGPQVMRGYWQNPEETARAIDRAGWFHTGDIGVRDAEGYLRVVDRIKDVIIVSGFNVFPVEIEEQLLLHPAIREACAVAVGDKLAPVIKVFVVTSDPALDAEAVIAHCRRGLAPYKVPKLVEFRAELPKSSVGKVLRRELRDATRAGTA